VAVPLRSECVIRNAAHGILAFGLSESTRQYRVNGTSSTTAMAADPKSDTASMDGSDA